MENKDQIVKDVELTEKELDETTGGATSPTRMYRVKVTPYPHAGISASIGTGSGIYASGGVNSGIYASGSVK